MQQDWSDAWLQQAAGWKAVKEGYALFRQGSVLSAEIDHDQCHGVVGGVKARRVTVKRLTRTIAETTCSCAENRRSGAMCDHAVAVIMTAREGGGVKREAAPVSLLPKTGSTSPVTPPKKNIALSVSFSPHWEKEWQHDRLMIKVDLAKHRSPDESDERLFEWAQAKGLSNRPWPWQLNLSGSELEQFLEQLIDHQEIKQSNETIVCLDEMPNWDLSMRAVGETLDVESRESGWQTLGLRSSRWLRKSNRLIQAVDSFWRDLFFTLIESKSAKISDLQDIGKFLQWHLRNSDEQIQGESSIECVWLPATWDLVVEGSWRELRLRVDKHFVVGGRSIKGICGKNQGVIAFESNVCYFEDFEKEATLVKPLRAMGWQKDEARGLWKMTEEESVVRYLSEERDRMSTLGQYREADPLREMIRRLSIVKPTMEQKLGGPDEWTIGFRSHTGKALDPQKIRALLKSNKRLIQTSDGSSVILPKESWEVFERSMADLGWKQSNVGFSAPSHHHQIVQYLRQYFDKSLVSNDLHEEDDALEVAIDADLRPYQKTGIKWLSTRLVQSGFALLADDMGLGKTLQTITLLSQFASVDRPALVVVPTSLLRNWENEIARFAPHLQTIVYHGQDRELKRARSTYSVIVTSYGILSSDRVAFMSEEYSLVVLDEAGAIRNPDTDVARACYRLRARYRMALTGTPVENRLSDLWSIFQFLQPGLLGKRETFRETYEQGALPTSIAMQSLKIRVMPFVLRRTKEQVASDLPEKTEVDHWCEMSKEQWDLYQTVRDEGMIQIEQEMAQNQSSAHLTVLTLLLRLRQICCDAALVAPEWENESTLAQRSPKMERLFELITETISAGRKILVFSQFSQQLGLIERECVRRGILPLKLDGSTRNRQALVDRFQSDDESQVFLISLKAGGYGLNLTRASVVVHFDPWWNPAAERQASDRAHRIGQQQKVTIHRLLTQGTVEDRVRSLQQKKSQIADALFSEKSMHLGDQAIPDLSDLKELLELLP
ncbi:MAG: DEAD/DEAH box helicase [Verrucomicrobia bacterium]|nr:MAG: DEAD/DEAH box helicase [Verrucomicrobiota bacterium]